MNHITKKGTTDCQISIYSHSKSACMSAQEYKKSKYFRKNLEPFIGKRIVGIGIVRDIKRDNDLISWICISNFIISKNNAEIEHLWIAVNTEFIQKYGIQKKDCLKITAFVYEYKNKNGRRNIGLKVISIRKSENIILEAREIKEDLK